MLMLTHTNYVDNIYVKGPVDRLYEYALKYYSVDLISLSFRSYNKNIYIKKKSCEEKEIKCKNFKYILDFWYLRKNLKKQKYEKIICGNSLIFIYIYILFGKEQEIYLYLLDYSENRGNKLVNLLYQMLIKFSVKKSKRLLSPAKSIIEKFSEFSNHSIFIPNYPLDFKYKSKVQNFNYLKMVIPFTTIDNIDFKTIINCLSEAIHNDPDIENRFSLFFIGLTEKCEILENYIDKLNLSKKIKYKFIENRNDYMAFMSSCNIGLELNNGLQDYNKYRDPIKIREYIHFSMPIISCTGHAACSYINKFKLGFVFSNKEELYLILKKCFYEKNILTEYNTNLIKFYNFNPQMVFR